MTSRTPTGRAIQVPDLVGVKADQAIQRLRELGLMPITCGRRKSTCQRRRLRAPALTHPPTAPVRPKTHITMSVATHPDFEGRYNDAVAGRADKLVHPPLTGPEICDHFAISPGQCRDTLAQLQEHGLPAKQSR